MRFTVVVVLLVGCGGSEGPLPPDAEPLRFDLDIVANDPYVAVWLREHFATECRPEEIFPHVGECATYEDYSACGGDQFQPLCLTRVAVERDGVVLGEGRNLADWWRWVSVDAPGLFASPGATLVIEGCGGTAAIPLAVEQPAVPVLTDVSTDGYQVFTRWSADPVPDGSISLVSTAFTSNACHQAGPGPGHVATGNLFPMTSVAVATVSGPVTSTTPWGTAMTWAQSWGGFEPAFVLGPPENDVWPVADMYFLDNVQVVIDGSLADNLDWTWGIRVLPSGEPRTVLTSIFGDFRYEAGETTDSIRLETVDDGVYVGTFPHVSPSNDLEFWKDGDLSFALDLGTVTLAREDDPSITRPYALAVSWEHLPVARLVPF